MDCRLDYFPIQEGRSYFHSWMVPFEDGWRARREAQESMKHPPDFNLLMLKGNPNCDNYASSIAQAAGIGTSAGLAQRVPIQIPVLTSMGGTLVEAKRQCGADVIGQPETSFPEPDGIGPLASASD